MTLATCLSDTALTQAQQAFEAELPGFDRIFHKVLARRMGPEREDAVAEARAGAWKTWLSLTARGRDPLAIGAANIAAFTLRQVLSGRTVAGRSRGRSKQDIFHPRVRRRHGVHMISYDAPVRDEGTARALWKALLRTDLKTSVPRQVAFKIDFLDWLGRLPQRKRRMAELLAEGHDTTAVARLLGVTPAAVSQARTWLERSWRQYQAGPQAQKVAPRPRDPRGRKAGARPQALAMGAA